MGASGGSLTGLVPPGYAANSGLYYLPSRNIANMTPAAIHKIRSDLYAASSGSLRHWAVIGDSLPGGNNGNGTQNDQEQAFPAQLLRFLVQDLPGMAHGGVGARAMSYQLGVLGAGWAMTGGFTVGSGAFGFTSSGGTATYTSPQAGTSVSLIYHGQSNAFSFTVGGGAPNNVTPTGANAWETTTVTGQTVNIGTQVVVTAGTVMELSGIRIAANSGLCIHNIGYGGARLNSGTNAVNWSDYSAVTTMANSRLALLPSGISVVFIEGGANDAGVGVAAATALQGVGNLLGRSQLAGATPVDVLSWHAAGTSDNLWNTYGQAWYADAASRGAVLVDWNDRIQGQSTGVTDGVLGPDNTHPTYALNQGLGKSVADALLS